MNDRAAEHDEDPGSRIAVLYAGQLSAGCAYDRHAEMREPAEEERELHKNYSLVLSQLERLVR